jgi:cell division protein ZapA
MMRIELLGTSFQIQSDESPEYIETILNHYRERVAEIEATVATADPLKKAILAALLVTDELYRLKNDAGDGDDGIPHEEAREIERITTSLLERLENSLDGE